MSDHTNRPVPYLLGGVQRGPFDRPAWVVEVHQQD